MSQALVRIAAGWLLGLMLAVAAAIVAINLVNNSVAESRSSRSANIWTRCTRVTAKRRWASCAPPCRKRRAMLDGTALQTAASRLANVKIGDPEERGGEPGHGAGGVHHRRQPAPHRVPAGATGTEWLFFNTWAFVPAAAAHPGRHRGQLQRGHLNGVPVNMPDGRNSFAVFYPGEYEATLNGEYFAAPATRATVSGRDVPTAPLNLLTEATERPEGGRGREGQGIPGHLRRRGRQAAEAPARLPVLPRHATTGWTTAPSTGASRSTRTISIEPFDGRWVVAPLDGKARIEGPAEDLFTGAVIRPERGQDFSFTTRLDVDGDTIRVTPLLSY